MVSAASWVKQREGHLKALGNLYVSDWKSFSHMLNMDENTMRARRPASGQQGTGGGAADAMALRMANTQASLASMYAKVLERGEAVCTTFAAAAAYILAAPSGPSVEIVSHVAKKKHAGTHLFVAVGRDGVDITDASWIKADCTIVDCWAYALGWDHYAYPANKYNASPIASEFDRLELTKNVSGFGDLGVPVLAGGQATGGGGGGGRKCYITTATCTALGLGDDCEELNLLRAYRDQFLLADDAGQRNVHSYYDLAPKIVDQIDRLPNSREVYESIYASAIRPAVEALKSGDQQLAGQIFRDWMKAALAGATVHELTESSAASSKQDPRRS